VPGANVEHIQPGNREVLAGRVGKRCMVVFLGGVGNGEVSALRWLGGRLGREFLVVGSGVGSGRGMIESLMA
jgi:hypothetical protein